MISGVNWKFLRKVTRSNTRVSFERILHTDGLIRQYIPKGTDFSELTDEMLAEIEWKLNHRPRKSLGYRTPLEYCKQLYNFDFEVCCTSN